MVLYTNFAHTSSTTSSHRMYRAALHNSTRDALAAGSMSNSGPICVANLNVTGAFTAGMPSRPIKLRISTKHAVVGVNTLRSGMGSSASHSFNSVERCTAWGDSVNTVPSLLVTSMLCNC